MIARVEYDGRVYDIVSYRSTVRLGVRTTIAEIQQAFEEARNALLDSHPTVRIQGDPIITVGFGHAPPITVVVFGNVTECIECGCEGHPATECPTKK